MKQERLEEIKEEVEVYQTDPWYEDDRSAIWDWAYLAIKDLLAEVERLQKRLSLVQEEVAAVEAVDSIKYEDGIIPAENIKALCEALREVAND